MVINAREEIAEVEFYFRTRDGQALSLGSLYSRPDQDLLRASYNTVWSCKAPQKLTVFKAKYILSVVAIVPHKPDGRDAFYLIEKPGLDMISLAGYEEIDDPNVEGA